MAVATTSGVQRAGTEPSSPVSHFPVPLSERELGRLWRDQTFPPEALVTGEGERLRVIYRGRSGGGPGPDFRDALIATRSGLLQGDVELHVRSSDFRKHGHHRDHAYAGVVLHLVFWDDERHPTLLPGGATAPVAALAGWVEGRATEIARWLERPALWREPCFSALTRQGAPAVAATLERLGVMRFRRKTAAVAALVREAGAEEALWQITLEALAFGADREAFRLLAREVLWASLRARLLALQTADRGGEALRVLETSLGCSFVLARPARRPANRPARRLEGAARLAARFAERGLGESILDGFEGEPRNGDRTIPGRAGVEWRSRDEQGPPPVSGNEFRPPKRRDDEQKAAASLIAALTVARLIGRSRAIEIVANAALPWLAALGPEARARRAEAIFARLPLPARYGAVRHLHEAVGRASEKTAKRKSQTEIGPSDDRVSTFGLGDPAVPVDFRRQQGMLYLLREYCTQGGCGRCPLS
jgi:hypothetical protein